MTESTDKRQRVWQITVILTLFTSYALQYFTRNHLYITTDAFKHYLDPNSEQTAQKWLAMMYTAGWIAFVISKIIFSFFLDVDDNRGVKTFAFGLIAVPILTIFTALIQIPHQITLRITVCMVLWILMRAAQAPQWAGLMKILSNWTSYQQYGRVISFMSWSFLLGDACSRFIFGWILTFPLFDNNWRNVFYFGAFMTLLGVIPLVLLVKDSPVQRALPPYSENPDNAYNKNNQQEELEQNLDDEASPQNYKSIGREDDVFDDLQLTMKTETLLETSSTKSKMWKLCQPLLTEPMFYFVILMSFQISFMREYFNMFGALYLQSVGASTANAALISGFYPLVGGVGAALNGVYLDRMLKKQHHVARYALFPVQAIICVCVYGAFYVNETDMELSSAIVLMLFAGFAILGSYSMMYVLSLDLGGQTSPAIVAGAGDAAAVLAAAFLSLLSGFGGYEYLYRILTVMAMIHLLTSLCLILYVKCCKKRNRVEVLV